MVEELTEENFEDQINSVTPIIVDFWASWCDPCKMLAPIFKEVRNEYEGKLKFAKMSTEEFSNDAGEIEIAGSPCLVIFKDGQEIDRIACFQQKEILKEKIDAILQKIE